MEKFFKEYLLRLRRKAKRRFVFFCVGLGLGLLGLIAANVLDPRDLGGNARNASELESFSTTLMLVFALPVFLSGIVFLSRRNLENTLQYKLFVSQRDSVVWAFIGSSNVKVEHVKVGTVYAVNAFNASGRGHCIRFPRARMEEFRDELDKHFPKATIGWTNALQEQYKKDPASLLRS